MDQNEQSNDNSDVMRNDPLENLILTPINVKNDQEAKNEIYNSDDNFKKLNISDKKILEYLSTLYPK